MKHGELGVGPVALAFTTPKSSGNCGNVGCVRYPISPSSAVIVYGFPGSFLPFQGELVKES
jgi:hypothetical protein